MFDHVPGLAHQLLPHRLDTLPLGRMMNGVHPWPVRIEQLSDKERQTLAVALGQEGVKATATDFLAAADKLAELDDKSPVRRLLMHCAADYLGRQLDNGRPLDAVARFHLGNGARVERLNWAGDMSVKGIKQSYGLMVNYLYDLKRLDKYRVLLAQGKIPVSPKVKDLYI
jgi:malonyl-CoA decarboxylase